MVEVLEGDAITLNAYADNLFADSLGSMFEQSDPIRVRVKVDDNAIVEIEGAYPNTLATDMDDVKKIIAEFLGGKEARIRTQHRDEQHTFVLSLAGFEEAVAWAISKCGFQISTGTSSEESDE